MKKVKAKAKASVPLRGKELARAIINHILTHRNAWDQTTWHSCNSTHCFFGWGQVLAGLPQSEENIVEQVQELLEISESEANWASSPRRTITELYRFVSNMLNPGFDRTGFDRDGFDRTGFNRDGFDRDGFDRDGFDSDGFDRDGFDRTGFDRTGFDRDGFDRTGFNRDGFDRDGFDRDGFDRTGKSLPLL